MYQQVYDPVAGNLVLSTVVAIIPIVVLLGCQPKKYPASPDA